MNRYVVRLHSSADDWHPAPPPMLAIKQALVVDPDDVSSVFLNWRDQSARRSEMLEWLNDQEVSYHFTLARCCFKREGERGPVAITSDCVMLCLEDEDAAFWLRVAYDKKPLPLALDMNALLQGTMSVAKAHWI
jgi:hypothetical protein